MQNKSLYLDIEKNVKLYVETYGDRNDTACLLISGAGANSSFWSKYLCGKLVEEGFFVIAYDHRDFGYSTKIDYDKDPFNMMDMVKDALNILDHFNIQKAHVVGHSMGGFIVQLLAIHHINRIETMTSISSSTSSPLIPDPPVETWKKFMENKPTGDFKSDITGFLKVWEYLNGNVPMNVGMAVDYTRNLYERQEINGPLGESHVKAQVNLSDRTELLKKVDIPALIIHGEEDYLVDKYGGIQTAECIKNSKLVLIPEMGHVPFNIEILKKLEQEIIEFLKTNKNE